MLEVKTKLEVHSKVENGYLINWRNLIKINAVKFDIKLLEGDDGILKTLNTYNALYHDKCKNDYGKAELDR